MTPIASAVTSRLNEIKSIEFLISAEEKMTLIKSRGSDTVYEYIPAEQSDKVMLYIQFDTICYETVISKEGYEKIREVIARGISIEEILWLLNAAP